MRAGDIVRHRPSGEQWQLAYADQGKVSPCGWPEGVADESDCEVIEACSDGAHIAMLQTWADKGPSRDHRVGVCALQLAALPRFGFVLGDRAEGFGLAKYFSREAALADARAQLVSAGAYGEVAVTTVRAVFPDSAALFLTVGELEAVVESANERAFEECGVEDPPHFEAGDEDLASLRQAFIGVVRQWLADRPHVVNPQYRAVDPVVHGINLAAAAEAGV